MVGKAKVGMTHFIKLFIPVKPLTCDNCPPTYNSPLK